MTEIKDIRLGCAIPRQSLQRFRRMGKGGDADGGNDCAGWGWGWSWGLGRRIWGAIACPPDRSMCQSPYATDPCLPCPELDGGMNKEGRVGQGDGQQMGSREDCVTVSIQTANEARETQSSVFLTLRGGKTKVVFKVFYFSSPRMILLDKCKGISDIIIFEG